MYITRDRLDLYLIGVYITGLLTGIMGSLFINYAITFI